MRAFILIVAVPLFLCIAATAFPRIESDKWEFPLVNGLRQAISIQGDTSKPLLLFLHGGPGRPLSPFAATFTQRLPDYFAVVQWDQRGAGETELKNHSPRVITPELMEQDALAMVRYLLQRFHHRKLYLVSHSWGSFAGFSIAAKHPELLYSYVAISPVIDLQQSVSSSVKMLRAWADSTSNYTARKELSVVRIPYRNENEMFVANKWLFIHNGVEGTERETFKTAYLDWLKVWFPVWKASVKNTAFAAAPAIRCPFWLWQGQFDNQVPGSIALRYFKALHAPEKHFVWFEQSGHTVFNTEPQKVEQVLIDSVLRKPGNMPD